MCARSALIKKNYCIWRLFLLNWQLVGLIAGKECVLQITEAKIAYQWVRKKAKRLSSPAEIICQKSWMGTGSCVCKRWCWTAQRRVESLRTSAFASGAKGDQQTGIWILDLVLQSGTTWTTHFTDVWARVDPNGWRTKRCWSNRVRACCRSGQTREN